MGGTTTGQRTDALAEQGFVSLAGGFETVGEAFGAAAELLSAVPPESDLPPLEVIGDFTIPPVDGPPSRDFQTLHFDFGLPLDPAGPADVARFTALHVPRDCLAPTAVTRLVPLRGLLGQVGWPGREELLGRLLAYGESHGSRVDEAGYTEGSLARVIEAAAGGTPRLPSIPKNPDFLCGNEFADLESESDFLAALGLSVAAAQVEVELAPGSVAVFDNLALAHGRRGQRLPGELRQRAFGHRALDVNRQAALRDRVLTAFEPGWTAGAG